MRVTDEAGAPVEAASETLLASWNDLAASSFGKLLGLDQPREKPLRTHANNAIAVTVELDPDKLSRGLAAATSDDVTDIMSW